MHFSTGPKRGIVLGYARVLELLCNAGFNAGLNAGIIRRSLIIIRFGVIQHAWSFPFEPRVSYCFEIFGTHADSRTWYETVT